MNSIETLSKKSSSFIILSLFLIVAAFITVLFIVFQFKSSATSLHLDRERHCKCQNLRTADFRIVNGTGLSSGLPWVGFLIRRSQKFDNMTGQYKTENEIVCTISIIGKKVNLIQLLIIWLILRILCSFEVGCHS